MHTDNSRFSGLDIRQEESSAHDQRIVKVNAPVEPVVKDFRMQNIRPGAPASKSFQASTSEHQKNQRFTLSQLAQDAMGVGEEAEERIRAEVEARVSAMAEEARAQAERQGFQEGLKQGAAQAQAQVAAIAEPALKGIESLAQQFEGAKEHLFKMNERFLIDLVYQVAKSVILREVSTDREYVTRLCAHLIDRVGIKDNLLIRISSEDAESIETLRPELSKALGQLKNLQIEGSPAIELGGCVIESEWGAIDATIETQLKQAELALKQTSGEV